MIRRLLGAVVDGFGHAAGRELLDEAKQGLMDADGFSPPSSKQPPGPTKEQLEKRTREAAKERETAKAREAKELDQELRALKKRIQREAKSS